jgi:hypothetical protein
VCENECGTQRIGRERDQYVLGKVGKKRWREKECFLSLFFSVQMKLVTVTDWISRRSDAFFFFSLPPFLPHKTCSLTTEGTREEKA